MTKGLAAAKGVNDLATRTNTVSISVDHAPTHGFDDVAQRLTSAVSPDAKCRVGYLVTFGVLGWRFVAEIDAFKQLCLVAAQDGKELAKAVASIGFRGFGRELGVEVRLVVLADGLCFRRTPPMEVCDGGAQDAVEPSHHPILVAEIADLAESFHERILQDIESSLSVRYTRTHELQESIELRDEALGGSGGHQPQHPDEQEQLHFSPQSQAFFSSSVAGFLGLVNVIGESLSECDQARTARSSP